MLFLETILSCSVQVDVTEEQLEGHSKAVRRGAIEGTVAGLLFSGAVSYFAHRRMPAYKTLPLSLKALGPVILIAPLLSIQAERRALEYDESQWLVSIFSLSFSSPQHFAYRQDWRGTQDSE